MPPYRNLQSSIFKNLAIRLKDPRRELDLSQEAFGAQRFISAPGWIKIENGQHQASEKLLARLTTWLAEEKYVRAGAADALKEELLTLKYLGSRSPFVREMARARQKAAEQRDFARSRGTRRVQGQAEARPAARHEVQEARGS